MLMSFRSLFHAAPLLLLAGLLATPPLLAGQERAKLPKGVTSRLVKRGDTLFHGMGNCASCHGQDGTGTEEGPSLISGQWKLASGDFESLLHLVQHAGVGARGRDGDPAPMRGPTLLDSAQVRAVAAYVWRISRNRTPPNPEPQR